MALRGKRFFTGPGFDDGDEKFQRGKMGRLAKTTNVN